VRDTLTLRHPGESASLPQTMHLDLESAGPTAGPPGAAGPDDGAEARRAVRLLSQLALFEGVLHGDDVGPFGDARVGRVPSGTVLFEAGQPADTLYVVVLGKVRLLLGRDPGARLLASMGRGDTIGLAALLRADLYPVTATVAEDATLVALPAADVRRAMLEHPLVAARLVGDMGAKLARFVRDIGGFMQRGARARVARMLLDLDREAGEAGADIAFAEPKRAIAARLAMTPETLSRELHALAALGFIDSRRTRFSVLDAAGLARAAEEGASPRAGER
jgi:CRP-like cAMP-binding protein